MPSAHALKYWLYLAWEGKAHKARAVAQEALGKIDPVDFLLALSPWGMHWSLALNYLPNEYLEALRGLSLESWPDDTSDYYFAKAALYDQIDRPTLQRAFYDSARQFLETKIKVKPNVPWMHTLLGMTYIGLGRNQEAIREGERGAKLLPVSEDAINGPELIRHLAFIYAMSGDHDAAIDRLEYLLTIPGWTSPGELVAHPAWDILRDHPRFQALLEKQGEQ
jgi:tetratricopeptide (TPR) repeat protein